MTGGVIMSGLLSLCKSVINPVDHAAQFTGPKKKKARIYPAKKTIEPIPPYSTLWHEKPTIKAISLVRLKRGERVKKCPNCDKWKGCDTRSFQADKRARIGLSSWCRECIIKREKNKHNA